jgi:hypothetical protein
MMKVIASTSNGWLLECSDVELGRLAGYRSNVVIEENGYFNGGKRYDVGSEIPIAAMYDYLTNLMQIESTVEAARRRLEKVAILLTIPETLKPILNAIQKEGITH